MHKMAYFSTIFKVPTGMLVADFSGRTLRLSKRSGVATVSVGSADN